MAFRCIAASDTQNHLTLSKNSRISETGGRRCWMDILQHHSRTFFHCISFGKWVKALCLSYHHDIMIRYNVINGKRKTIKCILEVTDR